MNKSNNQKVITIPSQPETKDWQKGDLVEIRKVEIK
jgi:hypothetical protein